MIEGGGIKLELLTVRGSRSVTVRGNSSGNGINWRLLVASRKRNRPVGEDLPLRVVFPLGEDMGCVLLKLSGDTIRPPPPANL
jgi:hypothetical protein